jgi:nucleoside-triphosphatase
LITGPPRCGKTTLIMRLSQDSSLSHKIGGFITEEFREKGQRLGFKIITLPDKKEGLLARKGYSSAYRVGKYGVNVQDFEKIGCSSLEAALHSGKFIVIDEIGKMELFSEKFKTYLYQALEAPQKMLATIMETKNEFADRIKKRKDVRVIFLNRDNFDRVYTEVQEWIKI